MKAFIFLFLLTYCTQGTPLEEFLAHPSLKTASVGVHIISLDGTETIASHQADLALIPASTMKAVTTATALQLRGPNHTFSTRLFLVDNHLVIKGGGDPTLSASSPESEFSGWHAALLKAGLTELKGDLIVDPSRFEDRTIPDSWPWGDIGNYYGAGACGLNYHKNSYRLTFKPGKLGGPAALVSTFPTPPEVIFENHMRTGTAGSGDQGYVYAAPGGTLISMRGTIPFGGKFSIKGALPNPPLSCATAFRDYLKKRNFPILGKIQVKRTQITEARLLHQQESPKLSIIIKATNHRSVNLYADSIFKELSKSGSTSASASKIKLHWSKQGVDMTGFVAHDGSGLSPRNSITARQLASIVKRASSGPHADNFIQSLPLAGKSGTLRTFGKNSAIAGRVRAKSGSLTRVRTYTGILTTYSGKKLVFAIMTNNTVSSPKAAIVNLLSAYVK